MLRGLLLTLLLPFPAFGQPEPLSGTQLEIQPNTTVEAVWNQLNRQFPQVIEDRSGVLRSRIELTPRRWLFWELLESLAIQSGSILRVLPAEGKIQFVPGGPSRSPTAVEGPFRLRLQRIRSTLELESRTRSSLANLEVVWDPHLHPFFVESRPQQLRLQTGLGKPLPGLAEGSATIPVDGRIGVSFDFRLPPIDREEKSIGLLEGKLTAVVPTRMVPIALPSISDLEAAASADAPELAFPRTGPGGRVSRIVRTRDRWSVQVVVQGPKGADLFESYQSWVIQNEATLRTGDGKVWRTGSYFLEANTPTRAVVTYHFMVRECPDRPDPAVWRFHYTTPAAIVNREIPFRFTDIPLP